VTRRAGVHTRTRRRGFVLLPVTLLLAVIAAAAWMLSREGAAGAGRVAMAEEGHAARYVAEAGLAHAGWTANASACTGYAVGDTAFGAHTYNATFTPASGSPVTIAATATLAGGARRTLTRAGVPVYEPSQTLVLQPDPAAGKDTWVYEWKATWNYGLSPDVYVSNFYYVSWSNGLLQFDLSGVPAEATVLSATLELRQRTPSSNGGRVSVHAVTSDWIEGVKTGANGAPNWSERDAGVPWTTAGGDYAAAAAASADMAGGFVGWVKWDVTALVDGWVRGAQVNRGLALVPAAADTDVTFNSSDDGTPANRPRLTVVYACECGISPTAALDAQPGPGGLDTHLRAGVPDTADGAAANLYVSDDGATVDRALLRFDVSAIPPTATVTSATLALELLSVGSSDPATVTVHRATRAWNESQATWNEAQAGVAWTAAGGDYDPVPAASASVLGSAPGPRSFDVAALVQQWADATSPNRGVVLAASPGLNKASFASSDHATAAFRPRLTVSWTCPCGVPCGGGASFGTGLLMVVGDPAALSTRENTKKALVESFGFTVSLIDDGATDAQFRAAALLNDAIYVTGDVVTGGTGVQGELTGSHLGVVNEIDGLSADLGFWELGISTSVTAMNVDDAGHHVTQVFAPGPLALFTTAQPGSGANSAVAPGAQVLGSVGGAPSLAVVDKTAALWSGALAAGRRLQLPWRNSYDPDLFTADAHTLLRRALEWAATAPEPESAAYLDRFELATCNPVVDYRNSDGMLEWSASPWTETADGGDPCAGDVSVTDDGGAGALAITGAGTLIERALNLDGATWATAHLAYRRDGFDDAADAVLLEVSDDGGATWAEVARLEGPATDATYQSLGVDITALADVDSAIRLRASGLGAGDVLYVGDLRIETDSLGSGLAACAGTLADDFASGGYAGTSGGVAWASAWTEIGEGDGAASGNVTVAALGGSQSLRVENGNLGAWRGADLSAFTSATLEVDYRRDSLDKPSEQVTVEVSPNGGGSWTQVAALAGAATDPDWLTLSVDVSAYLGADTRVRFVSSGQMGAGDAVHFDRVSLCLN